jgi:hypothetical protein
VENESVYVDRQEKVKGQIVISSLSLVKSGQCKRDTYDLVDRRRFSRRFVCSMTLFEIQEGGLRTKRERMLFVDRSSRCIVFDSLCVSIKNNSKRIVLAILLLVCCSSDLIDFDKSRGDEDNLFD